ncbi:peptide ABC transporter substrate-binding protein [Carnobacterium gallinarum]|uniref:peptide ABC transporter substrate-binding protein n=1 Tax=Carnobacterium gallinarum TaxID=2749 RepID=UPI00055168C9|nr:peptide ABC transporter substrate-binding protein [Carnobacterium gallinarum]
MKVKGFLGVLALGVVAVTLASCGASTDKQSKDDSKVGSKTLNLMVASEVTTLDSLNMLDFPDAVVQTAIFEGLYALDSDEKVTPGVAKELPEISEDGKTYTIKLREDAVWSNGTKVTANDFVYAWKKLADPAEGLVYSFLIQQTILNGAEVVTGEKPVDELGVKAIDDYTLEVQLSEPKPFFTSVLTFPVFFPQNQEFVEKQGDSYGASSDKVIYNGPFTIKEWKQGQLGWDLKKNETYHDKKNVKSDTIHYEVIKESSTALNLYDNDELDVATLTGVLASENTTHPDFISKPTAIINYVRLNQKRDGQATPLANENVRKALALGLDKKTMAEKVIADGSNGLDGMIPSGFVGNPETNEDFRKQAGDVMSFDKKAALSYWEKAKKELGKSTIEVELMVTDDGVYKKMGEYLQGNWEENLPGLKISIRSMPTEAALNFARESNYDMFLIYWAPDYQDPISTLNVFKTTNAMSYSNPKYDELLEKASTTYALDLEKRWETLIEAEKFLLEDTAGTVAVSQRNDAILQKDTVEGIDYHSYGAPIVLKGAYKK